jgi:GT2 family glycosyltransferase
MKPVVVIPVFNAFQFLQSCLVSIDKYSPDAEIILIDDASTDERVLPFLESWVQGRETRSLLENSQNKGFVHSVNRGLHSCDGDVVLLNSDTEVTPAWLDALTSCLASDSRIATATPWSNNGEIASFPELCIAGPVPEDPAQLARLISSASAPHYPEIPTAVGFCMAISRAAIERIGEFDEGTFGRGYGEENDFSMRAQEAGMINVLCDDAYVAHQGGASFSPLGLKPDEQSMEQLIGKHPDYLQIVEDFIQNDPLAERRQLLVNAIKHAGHSMR